MPNEQRSALFNRQTLWKKIKFAGQSQERLSTAIANHIIENDSSADPMPRIIGIEGTWGSGKK